MGTKTLERKQARAEASSSLLERIAYCKDPVRVSFDDAWVGLEPTFSNGKTVRRWRKLAARDEDLFFENPRVLAKQDAVGRSIVKRYRKLAKLGDPACVFTRVRRAIDRDPWEVHRQNLHFMDGDRGKGAADFEMRFGIDPETYEFSMKPVPLSWLYDERFVRFLQLFVWDVPHSKKLEVSMAHGGGQYSFSAKSFLQGSLLADHIATKLDHPELSTWIFDYPNCDDRAFRATPERHAAFARLLERYWRGAFHPQALGVLRVENALFDRGFDPACDGAPDQMDAKQGPRGTARDVFQTNFAFARSVRLRAQSVHPGYWQSQNPEAEGYRPDQIMRYSEGNLNRVQIAGELHVKSGNVLDPAAVPELDAPLELAMLYDEAGWEQRGQMSRTSAQDMVEAILFEAHLAAHLAASPHVKVRPSLAQDRLLGGAADQLRRTAPEKLGELARKAREDNLTASGGRVKSDRIEPETLFWAAWHAQSDGERAEIAAEAVGGFAELVHAAAARDPRALASDPMEPHRHRVHPLLWDALASRRSDLAPNSPESRELQAFEERRDEYLARRPQWSPTDDSPPWTAS